MVHFYIVLILPILFRYTFPFLPKYLNDVIFFIQDKEENKVKYIVLNKCLVYFLNGIFVI